MRDLIFFVLFYFIFISVNAEEEKMLLKLKFGDVLIELYPELAPNHVKRFKTLSDTKQYDGVVFHRVIDGFMAQTGDVRYGNPTSENFDLSKVGTGGSSLPDLKAEFSDVPHERGTLSMARSQDPNSGNSQFFICFDYAKHLDRQYSVFGKVIKGMEFVDMIKKGVDSSGLVINPDSIISLRSVK